MEQPTVILPDGVTSTSLVSQSEMTQFVTNTLNVWLLDLEARIKKAIEQTIFALTPAVVAVKYIPKTVNIKINAVNIEGILPPTISVAKE